MSHRPFFHYLIFLTFFFSFLKEKDTVEAQNWANTLFQDRKTDSRFENVEYQVRMLLNEDIRIHNAKRFLF